MALSQKDGEQVLRAAFDDSSESLNTVNLSGLVSEPFDYILLTYVASGNGAGEIETVTYKQGGASGTTVATLTLTYDASDRISTITRS